MALALGMGYPVCVWVLFNEFMKMEKPVCLGVLYWAHFNSADLFIYLGLWSFSPY